MVTATHPAYAEQQAQQATLAAIRAEVQREHLAQLDREAGIVRCDCCGQELHKFYQ